MHKIVFAALAAGLVSGCATTGYDVSDLPDKDTRSLCRIAFGNPDQNYRFEATKLLARRGATADKCIKLIQADNAMFATAVAIGGVSLAAGMANGGYYPTYGSYGSYGVAWDQFYNGQWACRDKATGQFVNSYRCSHLARIDYWPG